jgi:uncharacterized protein (TIGR03118 family)
MTKKHSTTSIPQSLALGAVCLCALALAVASAPAKDSKHSHGKKHKHQIFYQQTNLVADTNGVALLTDTNLVNAWGISFGPTSPFWVSDNGTGLATLYSVTNDASGYQVSKLGLQVAIPGEGNPTGQTFNNTTAFNGDLFIFASEDGTVSGWRGALGTNAEVLAMNTNAVYKGITLSSNASGPVLLAANFREATIDVYSSVGSNAVLMTQYSDPNTPAGYAPFNVMSLGGIVFVSFAKQDAAKHDDESGPGHGFIDTFDPQKGKFRRFATGSDAGGNLTDINSPWGMAIAPGSFGKHGDRLLVGNFGAGTIMSFEADGDFRGLLEDPTGATIVIEGLWGLTFGNGSKAGSAETLFFSAGPGREQHGLFGALDALPQQSGDNDGDHDGDQDGDHQGGDHNGGNHHGGRD